MSARAPAGLLLLLAAGTAGLPRSAAARSHAELAWPLAVVYPTALRFIRVDRGCHIVDKDPEAAFVVFLCAEDAAGGKAGPMTRRGALELAVIEGGGARDGARVRVQVTLSDEPSYVELRFLELLERKLREERGAPPRPAPPPPVDAGR